MNDMNTTDRALSWDDEFTNEQQEFVLLPEGEYPFEVTGMERARFDGSAKLPPCKRQLDPHRRAAYHRAGCLRRRPRQGGRRL